jgi:hypothetical protein
MKQKAVLFIFIGTLIFSCSPMTPTQVSESISEIITESPTTEEQILQVSTATKLPTEKPTLTPVLISNYSKAYLVASLDILDGTEESCDIASPTWRINKIIIGIYDVTDHLPNTMDVVFQATGANGIVVTYTGTASRVNNHYELTLPFVNFDNELSNFNLVDLESEVTYVLTSAETGEQIGSTCNITKEKFAPLFGGQNGSSGGCNPSVCNSPDAMQFVDGGCMLFSGWYYYPPDQTNQTCADAFEYDACGNLVKKVDQAMCQGNH